MGPAVTAFIRVPADQGGFIVHSVGFVKLIWHGSGRVRFVDTSMTDRRLSLFLLLLLPAVLGGWAWRSFHGKQEPSAAAAPPVWQGEPPTLSMTDAGEIFKKAFWRRPDAEDEILHAVRHEWSDAGGLLRWQWFLVVKASPGLVRYLREENAFGLVAGTPAVEDATAPSWFRFKPAEVSLLQAPGGGMRLMFSNKDNTLYATASGRGFTRGAPEPPPAAQGDSAPGRLPPSSPPQSP